MQLAKDIEFTNARMQVYVNKKRNTGSALKKENKVYLLRKYVKTKRFNTKRDFKKLKLFKIF